MKYIKMSTFIYVCELLCLTLCLPMSHTVSGDKAPICCVPEQWEGTMYRPPDKSAYWKNIFFISHPKYMLWVHKRTVSMRRFF